MQLLLVVLGCFLFSQTEGQIVPFSLNSISTFLNGVKTIFGTGSDFANKFNMNYQDVYNNQLLLQTLNTFTNLKQREEADQQEQTEHKLLKTDMEHEAEYFNQLIIVAWVIAISLIIIVIINIKGEITVLLNKNVNKVIKRYEESKKLNEDSYV